MPATLDSLGARDSLGPLWPSFSLGHRLSVPPLSLSRPQRRDAALVQVLSLTTALSGATDLPTLLHLILTTSRELTNSDAGSIFLIERADQRRDPAAEDQL